MFIKLSASDVSGVVYGPKINPFPSPFLTDAIFKGKIVHARLGYTNTKMFHRYYKLGKDLILLGGMPDRVDEEKGEVVELKTYHSNQAKNKNTIVAKLQLLVYCFITGIPKGRIVLYDTRKDKITDEIETELSLAEFRPAIEKAVKLKKLTKWYQEKFKEIVKGAKNESNSGK